MTLEEQREAYRDGLRRYDEARRNGRRRMFHGDEARQREFNGHANVAEARGREALGLPPATELLEPDAGVGDAVGGWEIRWTWRDHGMLRVRPNDNPQLKYLLVTGYAPNQVIRGWLYGHEVMVEHYLWAEPPPPCWMAPQDDLRSLSERGEAGTPPARSGDTVAAATAATPSGDESPFGLRSLDVPRSESDLHELMARAIRAQGKVDPDDVFAEAEDVDLDDWVRPTVWDERDDPEHELPPIDPEQEVLVLDDDERGYGYEP